MLTVIQEICARIGKVTGNGLGAIIKKRYSKKAFLPLAILLLAANTINIGADIGAMAASTRLIFPRLPMIAMTFVFAGFIIGSEIAIPYRRYVKVLKYLALALFAYLFTAIIAGGNWQDLITSSIIPRVDFSPGFALMFVAMFGTTISPYLFFWQASEEAEEDVASGKIKEISSDEKPRVREKEIRAVRADTAIGMGFSQAFTWLIIVTTAGTLHAHGVNNVGTAEQAASALEPLVKSFPHAGEIAKTIFAAGIIGTGLLAVPVLAGSSAYALSDTFGWKQGLSKKFGKARAFYLVIVASTAVGLWINFSSIDPIQALIYSSVINGIIAIPVLFAIMRISNDKELLGSRTNDRIRNLIGWATFSVMVVGVAIFFLLNLGR